MKYRVEQLAAAAGESVDTIRFYQSRGLLPAPAREGRVAIYGREHLARLREIRALQKKGLTLAGVERLLGSAGRGGRRADRDLARAVAEVAEERITLDELAVRSGVPAPLIAAMESEGITLGRTADGVTTYAASDVELVRLGLRLLEAGVPLGELLALARRQHEAARGVAEEAVRLFDEHVREPIVRSAGSEEEASERLVAAFDAMLPAVTALVAGHFRRVLLQIAEEKLEGAAWRERV